MAVMNERSVIRAMMAELVKRTNDMTVRYIGSLSPDDPDEIVRRLGGAFTETDSFDVQGGHRVVVLEGRNGCEVVIIETAERGVSVHLYRRQGKE